MFSGTAAHRFARTPTDSAAGWLNIQTLNIRRRGEEAPARKSYLKPEKAGVAKRWSMSRVYSWGGYGAAVVWPEAQKDNSSPVRPRIAARRDFGISAGAQAT